MIEFDPVASIVVAATGEPGSRLFMVQARGEGEVVTLIVEKFQIIELAREAFALLSEIGFPREEPAPPAEEFDEDHDPSWRTGRISFAYEEPRDQVVLEFREILPAEEVPGEEVEDPEQLLGDTARFWLSRSQFAELGRQGLEVASQGRPVCPYCWQPMEPDGEHFCVASNGHGRGVDLTGDEG